MPSHTTNRGDKEGIPVSLMEAMAYELPVISTYHAGIPELVEQKLVKEKDVNYLTKTIKSLIKNKKTWPKIGHKNRQIILKKFSPDNVKRLVEIFRN